MRKILFSVLFPILFYATSLAQTDKPVYVNVYSSAAMMGGNMFFRISPESRYQEVKGSPYLTDKWLPGVLKATSGEMIKDLKYRYNVYGNEMQFVSGYDTMAISNPLLVDELYIGDRKFEYLMFKHNHGSPSAYFEVLSEGKIRLLKRYHTRLITGSEPVSPYHCAISGTRFVSKEYIYFQKEDELPEEINHLRSDVRKLMRDKWTQVSGYIKENHLKFRNEKDLKEIFRYYNSI